MKLTDFISLLGGVALFLFGMSLMGDSLKKVAGNKLELILFRLSSTPLRALLLGTGVTAAIQSSSATSVMVVGFVNSGMMDFRRAISVIHGALIGTSITGWIICLSSVEGTGWVSLFSTATISAAVALVGILFRMFSKKQRKKHIGDILLGFAVLMFGMQTMSSAVSPLKDSKEFVNLFLSFSNPVLGILAGMVFTAILQSASASVGIIQALSVTGAITFSSAWPLILGCGVGASFPVLLSAMGARTDGKRAALSYLFIEIAGAFVCALLYYIPAAFVSVPFSDMIMTPVTIAVVNTVFRVLTAVFIMPFNPLMERLVSLSVKESEAELEAMASFNRLDDRFLAHPSIALEQSRLTVIDMACTARNNISQAVSLLDAFSQEGYDEVVQLEELVDRYEDKLGTYLLKINTHELDEVQNSSASKYLHTLSDFERMSDHASNIAELGLEIYEKKIQFSPEASAELAVLTSALGEMLNISIESFISDDDGLAFKVEPLEECIDNLCDRMKLNHIDRLQAGKCTPAVGFVFNDLLTNFERIADHCSNIAVAMIETRLNSFDTHDYILNLKAYHAHHFDSLLKEYTDKYPL